MRGEGSGVLLRHPKIFTDFLSAVVTSEIAEILSLYGGGFLALKWKLKWFGFDLAVKLVL